MNFYFYKLLLYIPCDWQIYIYIIVYMNFIVYTFRNNDFIRNVCVRIKKKTNGAF